MGSKGSASQARTPYSMSSWKASGRVEPGRPGDGLEGETAAGVERGAVGEAGAAGETDETGEADGGDGVRAVREPPSGLQSSATLMLF
jgi:hypothetical protein